MDPRPSLGGRRAPSTTFQPSFRRSQIFGGNFFPLAEQFQSNKVQFDCQILSLISISIVLARAKKGFCEPEGTCLPKDVG